MTMEDSMYQGTMVHALTTAPSRRAMTLTLKKWSAVGNLKYDLGLFSGHSTGYQL